MAYEIETVSDGDSRVSIVKFKNQQNATSDAPPTTRKMSKDPFSGIYSDSILEPPYDLFFLSTLPERSNILGQCIEAMETNIDGAGFTLEPTKTNIPDDAGEYSAEAMEEQDKIIDFFSFCNPDMPYTHLCRLTRRDREATGNAYWEVLRNLKGEICGLEIVESHTMRLCRMDDEFVEYKTVGPAVNEKNRPPFVRKRFRKFVQIKDGKKVYFKELNDPRQIDAETGKVVKVGPTGEADDGKKHIWATEILHFPVPSTTSPYGIPRWIGNLLSVLGSRQSEEVNAEYFDNNTVPPLALLVSGKLGDKTVERITSYIEDNLKGAKGWGKMLVIEASPTGAQLPGMPQPRADLHFEHLADAQVKDGLFLEYDRGNREKIRSSFRLPPLFVGLSDDYTRATALESKRVAEAQVFGPERDYMDFVINNKILPGIGAGKNWKYKSLSPTMDDSESLTAMIKIFAECGMTIRECRELMSEILNRKLHSREEKGAEWLDVPMAVYLEQMRAGMQADEEAKAIEKTARVLTAVREKIYDEEGDLE